MTIWLVDDVTELMPDTIQHAEAVAQYNKFLKDLRETTYLDWLIEKKLVEAGGLGKRVYISLPRCNGKTFTLMKRKEELEAKDIEVCFTNYRDSAKKQPTLDDIAKVREYMIDWDLISNLTSRRSEPTYLEMLRDFEFRKAKKQQLEVIPYDTWNDLFQRQYLGRWEITEEEEDGNAQK
jgi:hypothetical protein